MQSIVFASFVVVAALAFDECLLLAESRPTLMTANDPHRTFAVSVSIRFAAFATIGDSQKAADSVIEQTE